MIASVLQCEYIKHGMTCGYGSDAIWTLLGLYEDAKRCHAAAAFDAGLAEAQRKVEDEFALDPDLPEGVSVRFDNRPLKPDDTEIFGRRCPDGVDDSLDEDPP